MELISKKSFTIVCVPGADACLFAKVQDQKFICYHFFSWDGDRDHLPALFEEAKAAGYKGRMALAAAFSDFRMTWERLPDMTEEEVKETMYWNSDRLFRLEKEMAYDFRILSHTPEGYTLLAVGAGLDTVTAFSEAAREAGSRIVWAVPPPMLFESEAPLVVGLAGRSEAGLYLWDGDAWNRDRRVEKSGAEKTINRFLENAKLDNVVWIPSMDCDDDTYLWWTSLLPGNEQPPRKDWMLSIAARVPERLHGMNLALPEDRPRPFFSKENRTLRLLQGAAVGMGLVAAILGVQYLEARQERAAAVQMAQTLSASRRDMQEERKRWAEQEDIQKERSQFVNQDSRWEPKLVMLADGLPAGISLQSIEQAGSAILIKGTADESHSVMQLQKQIKTNWQWDCRVESDKKDTALPLRRFVLRCTDKKESQP